MQESSTLAPHPIDRWRNAGDAGEFMARLVGFETPFTRRQMWRYARGNIIPCKRIGRRVWFSENTLRAIAEHGLDPREMEASRR